MELLDDATSADPSPTAHPGAKAVAAVFRTAAIVVLGLGVVGALWTNWYVRHHRTEPVGKALGYAPLSLAIAILVASALAFFGYVLDLLTEIADNTHTRRGG